MSAAADGYDVYAVIDASGNWDMLTTQAAILRMNANGVTCVNWVAIWAELLRDHKNPLDHQLMQFVGEAIAPLGMVTNNWMYGKGMYPKRELIRDQQPNEPVQSNPS